MKPCLLRVNELIRANTYAKTNVNKTKAIFIQHRKADIILVTKYKVKPMVSKHEEMIWDYFYSFSQMLKYNKIHKITLAKTYEYTVTYIKN